jgi:hypothetical protein
MGLRMCANRARKVHRVGNVLLMCAEMVREMDCAFNVRGNGEGDGMCC